MDTKYWMLDAKCWMPDAGCWMLDAGCWSLLHKFTRRKASCNLCCTFSEMNASAYLSLNDDGCFVEAGIAARWICCLLLGQVLPFEVHLSDRTLIAM